MTVLITGISGFLATYISRMYRQQGAKVIGIHHSLIKPEGRADKLYRVHLPHNDIYKVIEMEKPDVVVHAAGTASVPLSMKQPYTDFSISVPATAILLDALRTHAPASRFIFLSSAAVYGNPHKLPIDEQMDAAPISPYGYHKLMGEELCREYATIYNMQTTVLRIFSAYGPGLTKQVVYDIICKFMNEPEVRLYGTGQESRDFIHARDIASAIYSITSVADQDLVYNLASGTETKISELAHLIKQKMGSGKPVTFNGEMEPGKPNNWVSDISRIQKTGFQPKISLPDGIASVISQMNS